MIHQVTAEEWFYNSDDISGCDTLAITVSAIAGDQQQGPESSIDVVTDYGVPSEPTDLHVSFLTEDSVHLEWYLPTDNVGCISK